MNIDKKMALISVVGSGHVGLVWACCMADKGHEVIVSERDLEKLKRLNQGALPFYEPGLAQLMSDALTKAKLTFTSRTSEAITKSEISFVAVGTPSDHVGRIDLSQIKSASIEIAKALGKAEFYHVVVVRSSVTPGTTVNLIKPTLERISGKRVGRNFGLAVQPEFLREGSAIHDVLHPDRVVIGACDTKAMNKLRKFYHAFHESKVPILEVSPTAAEMIKLASNAFLATRISFINEIANICQQLQDVDIVDVAKGMGLDKRIGLTYLNAGLGFGGSCLPKDLRLLITESNRLGYFPPLLKSTLRVNELQPLQTVRIAKQELGTLAGKKITILGSSFKPNTDDIRESPSLKLIELLLRSGAKITIYDPVSLEKANRILGKKVVYASSVRSGLRDADCCILATEWPEFKGLRPKEFASLMRTPLLIDARRIYSPDKYMRYLRYRAPGLSERTQNC